jgi:hypothetical protein
MTLYRNTGGQGLSKRVQVLGVAASLPISFVLDHFVIRRYVPQLHDFASVKMSLVIGKLKLNIPGEWGIAATWLIPFLVVAILAFPFYKGWPSRWKAYWPRLIKVVCVFLIFPVALLVCALIAPLAEWFKIPTDYLGIGLKISTGTYETGEIEISLLLLPFICGFLYWLLMRSKLFARR